MTLADFPRISVDPDLCGGRPVIVGTRVRVTDVLDMLAGAADVAEITGDFSRLTEADIRAAFSFTAAQAHHPGVLGERPLRFV